MRGLSTGLTSTTQRHHFNMENGKLILFFVAHSSGEAEIKAVPLRKSGYKPKIVQDRYKPDTFYVYGRANPDMV